MKQDKRKQKRLDANLFVEMESSFGEILGRGVVVDVSLSGFAVDTELDLPMNSKISCSIEIPLKLQATVVRCTARGQVKRFGLCFVGQNFIDKFMLKRILKGSLKTRKI